nr:hypothetical protein [uncultured Lichenicoccus sp.]
MSTFSTQAFLLLKWSTWALFGGAAAALVVAGTVLGVELASEKPDIRNATIVGPVHAGDDLLINEKIIVPPGCIPKMMQRLCTSRDCDRPGTKIQVLTDSAMAGFGTPFEIPIPRDTEPRTDWVLQQTVSLPGCGPMSGVLTARSTVLHDDLGRSGVAVTTLPYDPNPSH